MATLNGQASYELRTDPLWDMPEGIDFSALTQDELDDVYQTAEDLGCTPDEAYLELKSINAI